MKKRNIVAMVIFYIITCGIYGLVTIYNQFKEMQAEGAKPSVSPVIALILSFVPYVGGILVGYFYAKQLAELQTAKGTPVTDNTLVYCIVGFFIPIVCVLLVQNEMNKMAA